MHLDNCKDSNDGLAQPPRGAPSAARCCVLRSGAGLLSMTRSDQDTSTTASTFAPRQGGRGSAPATEPGPQGPARPPRRRRSLGTAFAVGVVATACCPIVATSGAADWALDPTYGPGGLQRIAFTNKVPGSVNLAVRLIDGHPYVAVDGGTESEVIALGADGLPLPGLRFPFTEGDMYVAESSGLQAVDPAGRLYGRRVANGETGIGRLVAGVGEDTAFGTNGTIPDGRSRDVSDTDIDSSGRVLIASYEYHEGTKTRPGSYSAGRVQRFRSDGSLDATFGTAGSVDLGPVTPSCLVVRPDDSFLVVGNEFDEPWQSARNEYVIRRRGPNRAMSFTADGAPDLGFGSSGRLDLQDGAPEAVVAPSFGLADDQCLRGTDGSVDVFETSQGRSYVTTVAPQGATAVAPRPVPRGTPMLQPDGTLLVTSLSNFGGGLMGDDRYGDGWLARVSAFGPSLQPQSALGTRARVTVMNRVHNVPATALLLPTGQLLATVDFTARSITLARLSLTGATLRRSAPGGVGQPRVRITRFRAPSGYAEATGAYACASQCAAAEVRWQVRRRGPSPKTIIASPPSVTTTGRLALQLFPVNGFGRRLKPGRYELQVTATDAYGRSASAQRSLTITRRQLRPAPGA